MELERRERRRMRIITLLKAVEHHPSCRRQSVCKCNMVNGSYSLMIDPHTHVCARAHFLGGHGYSKLFKHTYSNIIYIELFLADYNWGNLDK